MNRRAMLRWSLYAGLAAGYSWLFLRDIPGILPGPQQGSRSEEDEYLIVPVIPKDGKPSIDAPSYLEASSVEWMERDDVVFILDSGSPPRVYPRKIMNYHEIVNERELGVCLSWCPLTGTAIAFESRLSGYPGLVEFGVSGSLYKGNLVMYDRPTGTLWSQILARGLRGELRGRRLEPLHVKTTTWERIEERGDWLVLDKPTGSKYWYDYDIYRGYEEVGDSPYVAYEDTRLPPKETVIGFMAGDRPLCAPLRDLRSTGRLSIDSGMRRFVVEYKAELDDGVVIVEEGGRRELLQSALRAYWFAWAAFYPDTEILG